MTDHGEKRLGWTERRRERKSLERERKGDSPEKLAERHTPGETSVARMLRLGGVDRESRYKSDYACSTARFGSGRHLPRQLVGRPLWKRLASARYCYIHGH